MRYDDGTLRLGAKGNLVVAVWTDAPTLEQLRLVSERSREIARNEGPIAYLNAILRGAPRFPPEVRAEVARSARDGSIPRIAVAHLVLLPGWQGPAARAFVRAAIAVSGAAAPNRVFGAAPECSAWLADRMKTWTPAEVLGAYESLRG